MCGRFNLRANLSQIIEHFACQAAPHLQHALRYNVAPTQSIDAIRLEDGQRTLTILRWGLVPNWAKDLKVGFSGINALSETLAEKPAFRTAFKKRRCLIPATGYYEWLKVGKIKQPYLYEINDGKPFAFAGLWEQWWGADHKAESPLESCTILTTKANPLAAKVHDRMPVILETVDYDAWLDTATQDVGYLFEPFPADRMTAKPVSTFVNNARNEGIECMNSA